MLAALGHFDRITVNLVLCIIDIHPFFDRNTAYVADFAILGARPTMTKPNKKKVSEQLWASMNSWQSAAKCITITHTCIGYGVCMEATPHGSHSQSKLYKELFPDNM